MTLEQLRIFVAVAEREHVTRASEALHLTQSAVSAAIAALEAQSRVQLFDRVGRRIELTGAGRIFLNEARGVLARAASAEQALADLSGLKRGHLTLAASQTIANYWLPQRLVAFRDAYPDLRISLEAGNTLAVAKAVHDGIAELGFVEGRIDDPALELEEVDRDAFLIVVAAGHPWARKRAISTHMLRAGKWVLREAGSGTRSEFEAAMHEAGIAAGELNIALELPSNEAVRAAVEAGYGASALSEHVAAPALRSGTLIRLRFALPERRFHAIWHRQRYRSKAAEAFLAAL